MHRRFGPVPTGRGPALLRVRLVGLGLVKVEGHRRERATLASASAVSSRLPLNNPAARSRLNIFKFSGHKTLKTTKLTTVLSMSLVSHSLPVASICLVVS
jgi:hypothetical protein